MREGRFEFAPGPKSVVAGGRTEEFRWVVLTEPGRELAAREYHTETAHAYFKRMKKLGKDYSVFQYSMGDGPVWMEIESIHG